VVCELAKYITLGTGDLLLRLGDSPGAATQPHHNIGGLERTDETPH
jgi:hypothetical protein